MLDAIVERFGEKNDVQVINDNVVNYKATRQMLMGKKEVNLDTMWWPLYRLGIGRF